MLTYDQRRVAELEDQLDLARAQIDAEEDARRRRDEEDARDRRRRADERREEARHRERQAESFPEALNQQGYLLEREMNSAGSDETTDAFWKKSIALNDDAKRIYGRESAKARKKIKTLQAKIEQIDRTARERAAAELVRKHGSAADDYAKALRSNNPSHILDW
jgi:hypothetical protein